MTLSHDHQSPASRPFLHPSQDESRGVGMNIAHGNTRRRMYGDSRNNSSRVSTREFSDWIKEQANRYSEKELADITGLSIKAAQNLKAGKSGGAGSTVANWCMNDVTFAAAYAEFVGLILPGEAEFAGAFTLAVNAYVRRKGSGA